MRRISARFTLHSLFVLFAMLLAVASTQTHAYAFKSNNDREIQVIAVSTLPPEGRETLQLIKRGGPFPYSRDGVIFSNFEKRLPKRERGYYREFTVKTPGARNRGARRIVCGQPVECYYSADHYQTFRRITE
jgi:ribonuclease T1